MRGLGAADRVLWSLALAGVGVRLLAMVSWWPTTPTLADAWPYSVHAAYGLIGDPQHPAGYAIFLAALGLVSRQVAVFTLVQHALGVGAGLLMFAAVRRLIGSPWPALVPAAFVLLGADEIYLENAITPEPLFVACSAAAFYATVRAMDSNERAIRWAAAAGALSAYAVIVRSTGALLPLVLALALLLSGPRPWRARWRRPAIMIAACAALVGPYAAAESTTSGEIELGPSPGWQLYAAVAPFADCKLFTPPRGTARLCESTPPSRRDGEGHYLYDAGSPAIRLFGRLGQNDGLAGSWARQVIVHQPAAYLHAAAKALEAYFVPSSFVYVPGAGGDLGGLNWTAPRNLAIERTTVAGMETFFDKFKLHVHQRGLEALQYHQRVFRFGGTLLSLTALLTLLGLLVGPRRSRVGALAFGVGGLVMLLPPVLLNIYLGRYTVPLAAPLAASASITCCTLTRMGHCAAAPRLQRGRNERPGG